MAVDCAHCGATGLTKEKCWRCAGKGYFKECDNPNCGCVATCHVCHGSGFEPCAWCSGTGRFNGG